TAGAAAQASSGAEGSLGSADDCKSEQVSATHPACSVAMKYTLPLHRTSPSCGCNLDSLDSGSCIPICSSASTVKAMQGRGRVESTAKFASHLPIGARALTCCSMTF